MGEKGRKTVEKEKKSGKGLLLAAAISVVFAILTCLGSLYWLFGGRVKKEIIVVPQYVGRAANSLQSDENFALEREGIYSDEVGEGIVISQYPEGNARKVARGEPITVTLTVSLGAQKGVMPDLSGFDISEASAEIRKLGATVRVVYIYTEEYEDGSVIKSVPEPQYEIGKGQVVTLYVSKTQKHGSVKVRDFLGMSLEEAAFVAMSDGLCVGEVEYIGDSGGGAVISQSLAPDIFVKHGTYIDFKVEAEKTDEPEQTNEDLGFFERIREFFKKK